MKKQTIVICILMTMNFLTRSFAQNNKYHGEMLFQTYHNALEDAFCELNKAAHFFAQVNDNSVAQHLRSPDSVNDDLAAASAAVGNAIDLCSNLIEKQKLVTQQMQIFFNENNRQRILLEQKIEALEKEHAAQALLEKKMITASQKILSQIIAYSDYMYSLDKLICELVVQQNEINQRIKASTDIILQ